MTETAAQTPYRKGFYEWALIVALTFMGVDVICLFVAGAFHWEVMLKAAMGIFVYIQTAMTAASLLSIPVTLINIVRKRLTSA